MKWKFHDQKVSYYVNDTLKRTFTFSPEAFFGTLRGWEFHGSAVSKKIPPMAIDWVKYYDGTGAVIYQEDFNDARNFTPLPRAAVDCARKPCDSAFTTYYNINQRTNLSFSQIQQLYASKNVLLDICDDNLTLCGRTEPLFPTVPLVQRTPCDDSTMFAVSTATILHQIYRDSVLNSFDDRYLAKCLEVKSTEQFTVEHNVNEYHYTLYYYDQAGNLVKTVPPAGVDIGKLQWAAAWSDSVKLARKNNVLLTPTHTLKTDYRYNTLNQVVEQVSPDGGRSEFYYDKLGRLALSQNAKQRAAAAPGASDMNYSYTKYDVLGRITEVGEIKNLPQKAPITAAMVRNPDDLNAWHTELASRRSQITSTVYDIAYPGFSGVLDKRLIIEQRNLRNRVSYTTITHGSNTANYNQGTFYTYDIHGNVDTLLQDYGNSTYAWNVMNAFNNRFKKIQYDYDLISGKVNMVSYQKGWGDQFFHRYKYDAENRLTLVETSIDGYVWEKDARYEYYLHGPLARTVLGTQQVQGIDYAYTLQGWLKGVNSTGAMRQHDIGGDGKSLSPNLYTARDAYGFNLNYFTGDYQPSGAVAPFPGYSSHLGTTRYKPLYNGNISSMATAVRRFRDVNTYEDGANLFFNYQYDQLNRIMGMNTSKGFDTVNNAYASLTQLSGFFEKFGYDANGNILKLARGSKGDKPWMDSLTYKYYPGTNQLRQVRDSIKPGEWPKGDWDKLIDIDSQANVNNYVYDEIGNLIKDESEGIASIKWNVYGKIQEIYRGTADAKNETVRILYTYDASGNRISKVVELDDYKKYTWYVRDAQGNVMGVYNAKEDLNNPGFVENLGLNERYIYGSSRLGVEQIYQNVDNGPWDAAAYYSNGNFWRGKRFYELTNHLGNVLTTITDRKFGVSSNGTSVDYYEPDMQSATDYYAFGSPMRMANEGQYRYGFNGKENDNDVKGAIGSQQDYGMRIYDARLGRFLSVDPLTKKYPELTPYQFASNTPIAAIDLDGLEGLVSTTSGVWSPVTRKMMIQGDYNNDMVVDQSERESWSKAMSYWMVGGGAVAADLYFTGGKGSQLLFVYAPLAGAFEHNRAKTPEAKAAQDKRSREALTDAFIGWSLGKLLGKGVNLMGNGIQYARNRAKYILEFYKNSGFKEEQALSHLSGYDLTERVFEVTLTKGTKLEQWAYIDSKTGNPKLGNYFIYPGQDPSKVGIPLDGRQKFTLTLKEDTKFLQSTAADIESWTTPGMHLKGGGTQLFQTNVKYEITK